MLLAFTYRLWLPAEFIGGAAFPQVPLISSLTETPLWIDLAFLLVLIVGWCLHGFTQRVATGGILVVLGGAVLVLLNQHRFQPWHYQLMIFAAIFALDDRNRSTGRYSSPNELSTKPLLSIGRSSACYVSLAWFVASIYIYSAWSKVDYEFLHSVGQQFLSVPAAWLGKSDWLAGEVTTPRWLAALCIPLVELLIGLGVLFPRTRRIAGLAACVLHVGLVLILGPLGLNHSWGVLLWNVHFVGVAYWLYVRGDESIGPNVPSSYSRSSSSQSSIPATDEPQSALSNPGVPYLTIFVLAPVMLLPALERFTFWDHWPSWALYAPHSSRVDVQVAATAIDRLPPDLQRLIESRRATQRRDGDLVSESANADWEGDPNFGDPYLGDPNFGDLYLGGPNLGGPDKLAWDSGDTKESTQDWLDQGLWVPVPLSAWSLESLGVPIYPQARFQAGVAMALSQDVDSPFEIRVQLRGAASRMSGQRKSTTFTGRQDITQLPEQFRLNCVPRGQTDRADESSN